MMQSSYMIAILAVCSNDCFSLHLGYIDYII